jgi:hypothetical protein
MDPSMIDTSKILAQIAGAWGEEGLRFFQKAVLQ